MDFTLFIGNLKTYEMELKAREDQDPQKKKRNVAFKDSMSNKSNKKMQLKLHGKLQKLNKMKRLTPPICVLWHKTTKDIRYNLNPL